MVHDADIERAQAILWNVAAPQTGQVVCRECGSANLRPIPRVRLLIALSVIFVAIGFAVGQPVFGAIGLFAVAAGVALMPSHRCRDCGWASTPLDADVRRIPPLPIRGDMVELTCPRCGAINARALRRCEACGTILR